MVTAELLFILQHSTWAFGAARLQRQSRGVTDTDTVKLWLM